MGMVPIVLALLGFILLWSMVTYSSLQNKFQAGKALEAEAKRLYEQRNNLYAFVAPGISTPAFEQASLAVHKQMISEINRYISQQEQENNTSATLEQLLQANKRFAETYSAYLHQSRGYNQLINEKPFSLLASICKMQPLG